MHVAVVGAAGRIGSLTVAALERDGHEVRRISLQDGVNVRTGSGLEPALTGVDAVIDAMNSTAPDRAETVMVASWSEKDGVALVPPLLIQPIAPADVLARVAVGRPQGRHRAMAGPDAQDLVDMARRTHTALRRTVRLVPTWHNGVFDRSMAGDVLLPGLDVEIAPTTFDDWLAALTGR